MRTFSPFPTWGEVLAHVEAGLPVYYQAPLDPRPVRIGAKRRRNRIAVDPLTLDADRFQADAAHLSRFRKLDEKRFCTDNARAESWTLAHFRESNADDPACEDMASAIDALPVGGTLSLGGGAIAVSIVTRLS
jgi:hypothetical protein